MPLRSGCSFHPWTFQASQGARCTPGSIYLTIRWALHERYGATGDWAMDRCAIWHAGWSHTASSWWHL